MLVKADLAGSRPGKPVLMLDELYDLKMDITSMNTITIASLV
jgi:hypothetical protein